MNSWIPKDLVKLLEVSPKTQVIPRNHPVFVAKPEVGTTIVTKDGQITVDKDDEFILTRFKGDYILFSVSDVEPEGNWDSRGYLHYKAGFNFCDYRDSKGTALASSLRDIKVVFDWKLYKSTLSPYSNNGTYLKSIMDFSSENLKDYAYMNLDKNHFVKIGTNWYIMSDTEYKFYFTGEVEPYKGRPASIVDESKLDWKFVYTDFKAYCSEIKKNSKGVLKDGQIGCSKDYMRGKAVFKCNLEALDMPEGTRLDDREVTILYTYDKLHKQYTLRLKVMSPGFKTSDAVFSLRIPFNEAGRAIGVLKRTLKSSLGKKSKPPAVV